MHTVLKNGLSILLLTGASAGAASAAEVLYQVEDGASLAAPVAARNPCPGCGDPLALPGGGTTVIAVSANPAQFDIGTISVVPEPPAYMMLLIGVGLVSLVARRHASSSPKFTEET
ncbi:MAG: PEP-CTERM sorting domain-containing protein [Pseudomonadota bacterium]